MPTWESTSPYEPTARAPFQWTATRALLAAHIVGFVASLTFQRLLPRVPFDALFMIQAKDAVNGLWLWQFVTYAFTGRLDEFLWFVIMMIMLYQLGNMAESEIGPRRTLLIYFAGVVYGGLVQCFYQYVAQIQRPTSGFLSPGFFAIMTALTCLRPTLPVRFFFFMPMSLRTSTLIFVGLNLLMCVLRFHEGHAPFASVGATVAAFLLFKLDPKLDRWLDRREAFGAMRRSVQRVEAQRRVDSLLEKISAEGMGSLTDEEKRFLERASRDRRG